MKEALQTKMERARKKVEDWWEENAVVVMICAPAIAGIAVKIGSIVGKGIKLHREEILKKRMVWDPVLGHYWRLKRELTNDEWLWIAKRRKNGEMIGDILASLHVLR